VQCACSYHEIIRGFSLVTAKGHVFSWDGGFFDCHLGCGDRFIDWHLLSLSFRASGPYSDLP